MKKAYIIMAHKYPSQLHRLIDRLNDHSAHFFVHIDKKADINAFKSLDDFGKKVTFIDRFDSRWGKTGIIMPLLAGLNAIKQSAILFDRIMVLSGQDYPIKSNEQIDYFFQNSPHSVFINFFPIPNLEKWPGTDRGGLYRVDKYYFGNKWFELFCSKTINLLASYIPRLRREIPLGMKPFTGSTWFFLDMYFLDYILEFVRKHPEYLKFHSNTFVADELFVHMLIGNATDEKLLSTVENIEKHFIIWESNQVAHPKIIVKSDFEQMLHSDSLFARKFDEKLDSEILDLIDDRMLRI